MDVSSFFLVCRLVLRLLPTKHTKEHETLSVNHLFIRVVGLFRGQLLLLSVAFALSVVSFLLLGIGGDHV